MINVFEEILVMVIWQLNHLKETTYILVHMLKPSRHTSLHDI